MKFFEDKFLAIFVLFLDNVDSIIIWCIKYLAGKYFYHLNFSYRKYDSLVSSALQFSKISYIRVYVRLIYLASFHVDQGHEFNFFGGSSVF